ncbi:MAG: ABC transporter permease, partial [Deltaproteobacteria bacterium]|nr:ABC transporter permease [Deltaproteobacteria bacterium]
GWKLGDRITLVSTVPPNLSLEFNIVKVVTKSGRTNGMYLRRDYYEEERKAAGMGDPGYNIIWVRCNSAAAMAAMQQRVDAHFANTPNETHSMDENTFGAQFAQAAGDIPGLMNTMAIIILVIVALVSGNTMMMSFRERTRELAMLKAMGFQRGRIFRVVLSESLLLALLGGVLGVLPALLLLPILPLRKLGIPIGALQVSPYAIVGSLSVALLVGFFAGIWPAYQALRLRTVDGLRRVA